MKWALAIGLALLASATFAVGQDDDRPWDQRPYVGLGVRDTDDGPVVGWVYPGPLGGTGFESREGVKRGDNLVSVNGQAVDAQGFKDLVDSMKPGDAITLVLRRSPDASAEASVPKGGAGGDEFTVTVTLASRDEWAGTIGRGLGDRKIPEPAEGEFEAMILAKAARVGIDVGDEGVGGGLDALLEYLRKTQDDALDSNSLPAVVETFRRPLSADTVEGEIARRVRKASGGSLDDIAALIAFVLDTQPLATLSDDREAYLAVAKEISDIAERLEPDARRLVGTLRDSVYIYDDSATRHIKVIQSSRGLAERTTRLGIVGTKAMHKVVETIGQEHAKDAPLDKGDRLASVVTGDVLFVQWRDDGLPLVVVGGDGPNTYNMDHIVSVYDLGGDDVYNYTTNTMKTRVIIDLAGNDTHESTGDFAGPGTAVFGFSILDDRGGNDTYRSTGQFSIGAGLFGIGIILDHAGNDVYENIGPSSGWAMGVGFYGAGLIIDKAGSDVYLGEMLVQGVGGPRGFGAIIDAAGNDIYTANGPNFTSAYGTPAVYEGMSQGFGYGIRGYAAGGVGAIYDLGGDDQYEAGEFSQAGGYYFGMGIMHDFAGRDLYHGNRYGQAFSAHQAIGVLIDDAGDDTYWSKTAASQAGTWDQSIGMLIDRAGNDCYRCDGLGQGGASMQAIAILIDLDGADRYTGTGGAVQGGVGSNTYHYTRDKVFSLAALLDLGADEDVYSADRKNNTTVRTGSYNKDKPENSSLYGLFVDE